jgi:hypothetical protein
VAYNDEPGDAAVDLPPGEWSIVVNHERAGVEAIATARGKVTLPPYSMLVAHPRDGATKSTGNQPARRAPAQPTRR